MKTFNNMVNRNILQNNLSVYGLDYVLTVCGEEFGELIGELGKIIVQLTQLNQSVCKIRRLGRGTKCVAAKDFPVARTHMVEEMADSIICIENLKTIFSVSDEELEEMIRAKQERQNKRIRGKMPHVEVRERGMCLSTK